MSAMLLRELIGEADFDTFMRDHYLRDAVAGTGTGARLRSYATWETVERLVATPACDLLVARDGELLGGELPRSAARARALHAEGWSLVPRWAHRHDLGLAEIAAELADALHGEIGLQLYATPRGHRSFGWHYDAEEVFIVQTQGAKEYALKRNTLDRDPVLPFPRDLRFELETAPTMRVRLEAGDWLYIPGGWWHVADAIDDSISISVGVMATTPLALLDFARQRLPCSPRWRRRLPPTGGAATLGEDEVVAAYRAELAALAEDLGQLLGDDSLIRAWIAEQRERVRWMQPARASV